MADSNDFNSRIIEEFRVNHGQVGGFMDVLPLHHTGARSGTQRVSPLAYQAVGEGYAVFASKAGAPSNPDWFHNLIAHPDAVVEVGAETVKVKARAAEPTERDVIFARQAERAPQFAKYEETAAPRKIPVVVLDPVK
ncbi:MAG TPA: nitroreductase family deazaflavin-dependent oxidoreductase [Trebonia sp.]